ncbi:MAG: hypothetical protein KatS3mg108_1546 [Isosphaeraceae bacterium]|nr:MAG: hypothetical protein KatS3mg108_1546 [Isosphaeraceae bacterium]
MGQAEGQCGAWGESQPILVGAEIGVGAGEVDLPALIVDVRDPGQIAALEAGAGGGVGPALVGREGPVQGHDAEGPNRSMVNRRPQSGEPARAPVGGLAGTRGHGRCEQDPDEAAVEEDLGFAWSKVHGK